MFLSCQTLQSRCNDFIDTSFLIATSIPCCSSVGEFSLCISMDLMHRGTLSVPTRFHFQNTGRWVYFLNCYFDIFVIVLFLNVNEMNSGYIPVFIMRIDANCAVKRRK